MSTRRKVIIGAAVLFLCILLFASFILPGIIRNVAVERIEGATGRKTSIAKVSINPLTLSARVNGFRLADKDNTATFVSFSSARVSFSPASLVKRAIIVSDLDIVSPYLHLVRTAANTYNFSDLLTPKKGAPPSKPLLFSLNNIVVRGGAINFDDRAARNPTSHTVRQMEVAVPFFSNIPYLADKYVAPRFSALVNGAHLNASGRLKRPLSKAVEASLNIKLDEFDLPYYLAYLPATVPVSIASGRLSTDLELNYRVSAQEKPDVWIAGSIQLASLDLRERSKAQLLSLNRLATRINKAAFMSRTFDIAALEVDGVVATLERDGSGTWNFQRLRGTRDTAPEATPVKDNASKDAPKVNMKLATLKYTNGAIHLSDRLPPGGFRGNLEGMTFDLADFSTDPKQSARWNFSCLSNHRESLEAAGTASVDPATVAADLKLSGINLGAYYPYLSGILTAPVTGTVDVTGHLAYDPTAGLILEKVGLTAHNLAARFSPEDGVKYNEVVIGGGSLNLTKRIVTIEQIAFKGGTLRFTRENDGSLSPLRLLKPPYAPTLADRPAVAATNKPANPFSYQIRKIIGRGLGVTFTDHTKEESPVLTLQRLQFTLANVNGPRFGTIPFTLASQLGNEGRIRTSGTVTSSPLKVKGNLELQRVDISDFDAYLPENLNVEVADGTVDTRLTFNLAKESGQLTGSFGGSVGVRSFYCLDTQENEDLLKWESLQLDEIKGTITPFTLAIREVALNNVYSRLVINKNGTLNLQNLVQKEPAPILQKSVENAAPQAAATVPAVPHPAGERKISVGTVTIQEGTLEFSDHHLLGGFDTTFYHLGGKVSGLSSEENRFAEVDLRGNLENKSPLQITGTINPLRNDLFVDLIVRFTDIDLTPTTPYSGTYLGYTVDKGKLSLDLKYKIEKKSLTSENKVFIDQFTFGDKVESDRATNLPVRLAVALLKDRSGEIHLDLPVTGRTDDPKFSVWSVVLQMLKNLLVKAATSPLALLSAFGGTDDFGSITFSYGSAGLNPAEQEKLQRLAKALIDRPSINLEISGFVEREKDTEGYRAEHLTRKIKAEKFLAMVKAKQNTPDQTADTIDILPEEYSRYLKEVYRKEKFPKPRNALGFVKDIPDEEMRKLIITNTTVGDEQLMALARDRAMAVQNLLIGKGKLPPERLFLKGGDIYKAPAKEGERGSRVEFGANVK